MEDLDPRMWASSNPARAEQVRWVVLLSPLVCLAIALLGSGAERVGWGIAAVSLAAIVLPAVTRGRPLAHSLAQGFRVFVGLVLLLGGVAGCAGAIYLFTLGSYALLASFLVGPIAAVVAYVGGLLLFVGGRAEPDSD